MKKTEAFKLPSISSTKPKDLKKPYGFCCDVNYQDPETQYNARNPPFDSIFQDNSLNSERPDVKIRIQDIIKSTPRSTRGGVFRNNVEAKKNAVYRKSKRHRGPLKWLLEEEIEAARDLLAKEKRIKRAEEIAKREMKKTFEKTSRSKRI